MGRSTWGRLPLQEPLGQAAIVLASDRTWPIDFVAAIVQFKQSHRVAGTFKLLGMKAMQVHVMPLLQPLLCLGRLIASLSLHHASPWHMDSSQVIDAPP